MRLLESQSLKGSELNEDAGVVHGVKVLGKKLVVIRVNYNNDIEGGELVSGMVEFVGHGSLLINGA